MINDIDIRINTLVDMPRLKVIEQCLEEIMDKAIFGSIAEVGVYKGGTAALIVATTPRHVYLFDTFEGMPITKSIDIHKKGDFKDTTIEKVDVLLEQFGRNYSIYKGVFPVENSEYIKHRKFAFVHLDVDIYDSVKNCLEFFCPRMVPGGIILLDDYNEPNCPGAKLAANEFCANKSYKVMPTVQSQAIIRF